MDKLSVVIITHNEESNIGRCLDSVAKVADEIVVVDAYSTDKTEEICRQFCVRFYQREWDDFSSQKNYANERASYDYVLSIDADEALSEELIRSILQEKSNGLHGAYWFNRLTYFCGYPVRHCGWYPDRKLRIWDKNEARWSGLVHEELKFGEKPKKTVLDGDLLHYTIERLDQQVEKIMRYTNYRVETALKNGKRATLAALLLKPMFKFFKIYVLKAGFLDGFVGFLIARNSAFSRFLYLSKLRIEQNKVKENG